MTTPIELPCICHVPPPEGTIRFELRKPNDEDTVLVAGGWAKTTGMGGTYLVAIIAPQYTYPTPVEACRMIADAGGPIECESENGNFCGVLSKIELESVDGLQFRIRTKNGSFWTHKIRVRVESGQ